MISKLHRNFNIKQKKYVGEFISILLVNILGNVWPSAASSIVHTGPEYVGGPPALCIEALVLFFPLVQNVKDRQKGSHEWPIRCLDDLNFSEIFLPLY